MKSKLIIIILLGVFGIRGYGARVNAVIDEKSVGYQYVMDQVNEMKREIKTLKAYNEEIQMLKADNEEMKGQIKNLQKNDEALKADNKVLKADNKVLKSTIKSLDQEVIGLTSTVQHFTSSKKSKK